MFKKSVLLFIFQIISALSLSSYAVQWSVPEIDIKEIQIRAKCAKVTVRRSHTNQIQVNISGVKESDWHQEVVNQVLMVTGPEESINWNESQLSLEIPAGILSTQMVFEDVQAEINGVGRLTLTSLKGKIISRSNLDGIRYFLQNGEIQSMQQAGNLEIEVYGGKVSLLDGQGSSKVKIFSGDLVMERNTGSLILESFSTTAGLNLHQGRVALTWGKGTLNVKDFSGRFEGLSKEGQINIQLKPDAMVDLQANRGRVSVTVPTNSGAYVNLRTASGDLKVPTPLNPAKEGRFKVAKGRLSGSSKASVNIRGEEASISVR